MSYIVEARPSVSLEFSVASDTSELKQKVNRAVRNATWLYQRWERYPPIPYIVKTVTVDQIPKGPWRLFPTTECLYGSYEVTVNLLDRLITKREDLEGAIAGLLLLDASYPISFQDPTSCVQHILSAKQDLLKENSTNAIVTCLISGHIDQLEHQRALGINFETNGYKLDHLLGALGACRSY